jgi:hypothetical protein
MLSSSLNSLSETIVLQRAGRECGYGRPRLTRYIKIGPNSPPAVAVRSRSGEYAPFPAPSCSLPAAARFGGHRAKLFSCRDDSGIRWMPCAVSAGRAFAHQSEADIALAGASWCNSGLSRERLSLRREAEKPFSFKLIRYVRRPCRNFGTRLVNSRSNDASIDIEPAS